MLRDPPSPRDPPRQEPPLIGPLAAILPGSDPTWLLTACLQRGTAAREAWRQWQDLSGDAWRSNAGGLRYVKTLSPLLLEAVRRERFDLPPEVLDRLRAARLREELRWNTYRAVCQQVLRVLNAAQLRFMVLRGPALAETVWDQPSLRHSHDLNVLFPADELPQARSRLIAAGLAEMQPERGQPGHECRLLHPGGMPIVLQHSAYRIDHYGTAFPEVWERAATGDVAGVACRVLSPEEALVQVCVHASCSRSRLSLNWVCDAWFLLNRTPHFRWEHVLAAARTRRLSVPLYLTLGYLRAQLAAAVPESTIAALEAQVRQCDRQGWTAALAGAAAGPDGSVTQLLRATRTLAQRGALACGLMLPASSYFRWTGQVRQPWLARLYYPLHPAKLVLRRLYAALRTVRPAPMSRAAEPRSVPAR